MNQDKIEKRPDKKVYQKPKLTAFGKLNEITQGSTPGVGESAGGCGESLCNLNI